MTLACLFRHELAEVWNGDALNAEHVSAIMEGRVANALIYDAPYSEKTHKGHQNGKLTADRAAAFAARHADSPTAESRYAARKSEAGESGRRDIDYPAWTERECLAFCIAWAESTAGWIVSITDDVLAPIWRREFEMIGFYAFAPLPLVETGSRVRMTGDGPSGWTCWVQVARPRNETFSTWGTLPGAYIVPGERAQNSKYGSDRIVGGKPMRGMLEIVRDYSREGDLVVDPTAGGGTTGLACLRSGRRTILIECDERRAQLCAERIEAELRHGDRRAFAAGQGGLFT